MGGPSLDIWTPLEHPQDIWCRLVTVVNQNCVGIIGGKTQVDILTVYDL